jgi:hypothetical protein
MFNCLGSMLPRPGMLQIPINDDDDDDNYNNNNNAMLSGVPVTTAW